MLIYFNPRNTSVSCIIVILPVSRGSEVSFPGHAASKWESWDSNSGTQTFIDYIMLHVGESSKTSEKPPWAVPSAGLAPECGTRAPACSSLPALSPSWASEMEVPSQCTCVRTGSEFPGRRTSACLRRLTSCYTKFLRVIN